MSEERNKISDLLQRFVDGEVTNWEVDDFLSSKSEDPFVEDFRLEISKLPISFPAETDTYYTSHSGIKRLLEISRILRES
jgi:hypothetical protein